MRRDQTAAYCSASRADPGEAVLTNVSSQCEFRPLAHARSGDSSRPNCPRQERENRPGTRFLKRLEREKGKNFSVGSPTRTHKERRKERLHDSPTPSYTRVEPGCDKKRS